MIELRIIDGPNRGNRLTCDGESYVVRAGEPASSAHEPLASGGWVARPIAGGSSIRVNGELGDGRTALQVGDHLEADGRVYEVIRAAPPMPRDAARDSGPGLFVLRYDGAAAHRSSPESNEDGEDRLPGEAVEPVILPLPKPLEPVRPRRAGGLPPSGVRVVGRLGMPSLAGSAVAGVTILVVGAVVSLLLAGAPSNVSTWETPALAEATGDAHAPASEDPPGVMYLLDASGAMADRLPHAVDFLRERVAELDGSQRFLVALIEPHGLTFVPAAGVTKAHDKACDEALDFLNANADRFGSPEPVDRLHALAFAIAYAEPGDEVVLITTRGPGRNSSALHRRVAEVMAGCDLSLSVVQLYDDAPDPMLRRIAEDFGGDHVTLHAPRVASAR